MDNNFIVCVRCMTYNHGPYIEDAMNGFCMQETNFPFVCVIMDDASTDGEPEVIKNYLQEHFDLEDKAVVRNEESDDYTMIFAKHKKNKNCYFVVYFLKYNHYKKKNKQLYITEWLDNCIYIALCEGDDYWIASDKLQKQVEFLDNHHDYGLVYTAYREKKDGKLGEIKNHDFGKECLPEYLSAKGGIIATASTLFRCDLYIKRDVDKKFLMGDVPLWIQIMHASKAHFMSDVTTIYRILAESASHSVSYKKRMMFVKSALEARMYYAEKYGYETIAKSLQQRINRTKLLLDLYDLNIFKFIAASPWKYGITPKMTLRIIKQRFLSNN